MKSPSPQFPGWTEIREGVYERRIGGPASFVIVSKPDGWNWGYLVFNDKGRVLTGQVSSDLSLFDAVAAAHKHLGIE